MSKNVYKQISLSLKNRWDVKSIISILLCVSTLFVSAQTNPHAIIIGEISRDEDGYPVELEMLTEDYVITFGTDTIIKVKTKIRDGKFRLELPIDKPAYFQISVFTGKGVIRLGELWGYTTDFSTFLYLIEPGDSVIMHFKNNKKVDYSGRGSEKFKYRNELTDRMAAVREQGVVRTDSSISARNSLGLIDSTEAIGIKVLSEFKDKFSPLTYTLLNADIAGWKGYRIAQSVIFGSYHRDKVTNARYFEPDSRHRSLFMERSFPNLLINGSRLDTLLWSRLYQYQQTWLIDQFIFMIVREKRENKNYNYTDMDGDFYYVINALFSGEAREKLMTYFFTKFILVGGLNDAVDKCLQQYLAGSDQNKIYNRRLSDLYKGIKNSVVKGNIIKPFRFTNPSGKVVDLGDFKGKVVLLDFWYTGCSPCKAMVPYMAKVKDFFSKNKNVVFINISIDQSKAIWIKSIPTYSPGNGINLYTNGQGEKHPWIQYCKLGAYPRLILIGRDGKILLPSAPRPEADNGAELIKEIDKALVK